MAALGLIVGGTAVVALATFAGTVPAAAVAAITGVALAVAFRNNPALLVAGLLPASALIASGVVGTNGQYLPLAAVLLGLILAAGALVLRRHLAPVILARPVLVVAGGYVAWGAVSTVTSINPPLSTIYAVGLVVTIGTVFLVAPTILRGARDRDALPWMMVAVAVGLALAGFLLWFVGPILLGDRLVGLYMPMEIVIGGTQTGIVVPRITGIYLTPGYQGIALAVGIVAMTVMRRGRWRPLLLLAAAVAGLALFLTINCSGWMLAAFGCLAVAVAEALRRRVAIGAIVTSVVFLALLAALTATSLEVFARYDVAYARYGEVARVRRASSLAVPPPTSAGGSSSGSGGSGASGSGGQLVGQWRQRCVGRWRRTGSGTAPSGHPWRLSDGCPSGPVERLDGPDPRTSSRGLRAGNRVGGDRAETCRRGGGLRGIDIAQHMATDRRGDGPPGDGSIAGIRPCDCGWDSRRSRGAGPQPRSDLFRQRCWWESAHRCSSSPTCSVDLHTLRSRGHLPPDWVHSSCTRRARAGSQQLVPERTGGTVDD